MVPWDTSLSCQTFWNGFVTKTEVPLYITWSTKIDLDWRKVPQTCKLKDQGKVCFQNLT